MSATLTDKIIFITGASSGIGEALAYAFAKEGACVALAARRVARLAAVAVRVQQLGGRAIALQCDVTIEADLARAVAQTIETFGGIDVAIANAGFGVSGNLENLTVEDFRRQFETNVFGMLNTVYATLPSLKKSRGRLVLIGSVSGYVGTPGSAPYSMSKFSVRGLADSITYELNREGVSVTLISPGFIESEVRKVDNFGVLHEDVTDPIPHWLQMPVAHAAQEILRAVRRRKTEKIISAHGKIIVFVVRFFPWMIRLAKKFGLKNRPQPVGKM